MIHPTVDRRIFVVGVPRSGTTLVQSLLAAHSRTTSFTESHFFSQHFKQLPWLSWAPILIKDPTPRVRQFLSENGADADQIEAAVQGLSPSLSPSLFLPLRSRSVACQLLRMLDELACLQGVSSWIEKTPRHLRYIPFLERLSYPDKATRSSQITHFIHVIRDGLEVVASLHKASQSWQRPYDLDTCVRRWNEDVGFSLSRAAPQGSPRKRVSTEHFVFYEELTAQPEATLRRLLADLGFEWQPEILERYASGSKRLITEEETWKADVQGVVRPSATSGQTLNAAQRQQVSAGLRHDLYTRLRACAALR